jgi:hypothetical protein
MNLALTISVAIPPAILLASAVVLWIKTKRLAALLQLIAAAALFFSCGAEGLAMLVADIGYPYLIDAIRSSGALVVMDCVLALGVLIYSIGYLWYALSEKRI